MLFRNLRNDPAIAYRISRANVMFVSVTFTFSGGGTVSPFLKCGSLCHKPWVTVCPAEAGPEPIVEPT
jgi:hypothetical protein